MLGFILFTIVLVFYGVVLSSGLISVIFPKISPYISIFGDVARDNRKRFIGFIAGIAAIIIGLWNLFAPDFGAMNSPTIIGALIPSIIMIFNGIILFPEIVVVINISKKTKKKFISKMSGYQKYAGPVTLSAALFHIIFFRAVLF
jgi:hypothetical protein